MNDIKTCDIVSHILSKLGLKKLALDAQKNNNIDLYINLIKYKYKHRIGLVEFIEYFL